MRRGCLIIGAAFLLGAGASTLHAQVSPAGTQSEDSLALAEVTVTAQRREESLQRAALPVSAISGDALSLSGSTRVQELTQLVPAVQIATAAGPYPLFYVRGVGNFNGNALSDAALAVNLDGVYLSRPSSTGGLLFDVERLEVLKGPQGTLYGRNATGGALNIITRKPTNELGGDASVDVGNYNLFKVDGALNVPLSERVAARLALQSVNRDGYLSDGQDDADDKAARLQVHFAPADSLSLLASADYYRQRGNGVGATLRQGSTGNFVDGDAYIGNTDPRIDAIYSQSFVFTAGNVLGPLLTTALDVSPLPTSVVQRNDYWGLSTTLDWESTAGSLTVIPAYRHGSLDYRSTAPGFLISQQEADRQTSLEARFASRADRPLTYLVGAYYLDEDIDSTPIYDQQVNASSTQYATGTKSYAGFARLGYALSDVFRLTGGIRYTKDDKDLAGTYTSRQVLCPGAFIPPPAGPQFCFGGVGQIIVPNAPIVLDASNSWSETTWRAGAEWDVAPQSLLYASVETGFKAGGFFFTHDDPAYDPEKLTAYTLGSKNRFLEGRLQLNLEAFYWKYRDQQISHLLQDSVGDVIFATENVGKATMQGVEIDSQLLASENTLLMLDAQYLDATYDDFIYNLPNFGAPPGTGCAAAPAGLVYDVDCSGKTPPQAPRWTVNAGIQQTILLGNGDAIVGNLRTHYQTRALTGLEFLPIEMQDSYWMTSLALTYRGRGNKWSLTGYVDNIENEHVVNGTFPHPFAPDLFAATVRPPRTYGARFGVSF